jgi:hypothetical protein
MIVSGGRGVLDAPVKPGHDGVTCGDGCTYFPNSSRILAWIFAMPPIQRS